MQGRRMKLLRIFLPLYLLVFCSSLTVSRIAQPEIPPSLRNIEHVITIVFENTSFEEAYEQPYLRELARRGALLQNYFAITHPSQPNYIAMVAGTTYGVNSNATVDLDVGKRHVGDLFEQAGSDWKVYAEDYPGNCYLGKKKNKYVRRHVPFLSFKSVQTTARCNNVVELGEIQSDILNNSLPAYAMVIPNLDNDGHDTSIGFASRWLKSFLAPLLRNQVLMNNTLIVITFDEDDDKHGNRIYTALLGAGVERGAVSNKLYNHYSLLKTIENIFSLSDLGNGDRDAEAILDIWQ